MLLSRTTFSFQLNASGSYPALSHVPFSSLSDQLSDKNSGHNRIIKEEQGKITDISTAILQNYTQFLAHNPVSEYVTARPLGSTELDQRM